MRVRWDTIAMCCAGLAVVAGTATTLMSMGGTDTELPTARPAAQVAPAAVPGAAGNAVAPATGAGALEAAAAGADPDALANAATAMTATTLEEATTLVQEARDFTAQGRWAEAADRLATIGTDMRDASGAGTAQAELTAAEAAWTKLDAQLTQQVDAGQWRPALATLTQLGQVVPLDDEQLGLKAEIEAELAPAVAVKPKPAPAAPAAASPKPAAAAGAASGGGAAAAAPAAVEPAAVSTPAPGTASPKPTAAKPAAAKPVKPKPAKPGVSVGADGNVVITLPPGAGVGATPPGAAGSTAGLSSLLGAVAG